MSVTTERSPALAISPAEAADRLGISLDSFERHVRSQVRTVRVGRRILISVSSIEAFVEGEVQ
jgi:excisionase family DNA binding protein